MPCHASFAVTLEQVPYLWLLVQQMCWMMIVPTAIPRHGKSPIFILQYLTYLLSIDTYSIYLPYRPDRPPGPRSVQTRPLFRSIALAGKQSSKWRAKTPPRREIHWPQRHRANDMHVLCITPCLGAPSAAALACSEDCLFLLIDG